VKDAPPVFEDYFREYVDVESVIEEK